MWLLLLVPSWSPLQPGDRVHFFFVLEIKKEMTVHRIRIASRGYGRQCGRPKQRTSTALPVCDKYKLREIYPRELIDDTSARQSNSCVTINSAILKFETVTFFSNEENKRKLCFSQNFLHLHFCCSSIGIKWSSQFPLVCRLSLSSPFCLLKPCLTKLKKKKQVIEEADE